MKTKHLVLAGLVALLAGTAAHAQTISAINVTTASNTFGDVVMGFTNGGEGKDVVFDFGSIGTFTSLAGGTTYNLAGFSSAALSSQIGADWFNSTTPTMVSAGAGTGNTFTPTDLILITAAHDPVDNSFVKPLTSTASHSTSNAIGSFAGALKGATAISGTTSAVAFTPSAGTSYTTLDGNVLSANTNLNTYASVLDGSATAYQLELFKMPAVANSATSAVDLGFFTITSTGATFTSLAAIPEPSTYAAILGVATLGFAAIRRRKQNQLVA